MGKYGTEGQLTRKTKVLPALRLPRREVSASSLFHKEELALFFASTDTRQRLKVQFFVYYRCSAETLRVES
jgi:hypothetical protein